MTLEYPAFTRTKLDEEKGNDDIVNVRLNASDRKILNDYKELIGNKQDSTALKLALFHSFNVIHLNFSGDIKVSLFKKRSNNLSISE